MQKQIAEDDKVRDLVESLREMAGAASKFPNLQKIEVTIDIIEEIGLSMLEVATLINEYSNTSFMEKSTIFGPWYSIYRHSSYSVILIIFISTHSQTFMDRHVHSSYEVPEAMQRSP